MLIGKIFALLCLAAPLTVSAGSSELKWNGKKYLSGLLPIDAARNYILSGSFTAEKDVSGFTFGLELFDGNKVPIHPHEVRAIVGTETCTVKAAKQGDRELYVADASRWDIRAARIVAVGVSPDLKDLPARNIAYYVTRTTCEDGVWKLEFSRPLPRDIASGTRVRLHGDGRHPIVAAYKTELSAGKTKRFRHLVSPGATYTADSGVWWPGVRYARIYVQVPADSHVRAEEITLHPATPEELAAVLKERDLAGLPPRPFGKYTKLGNGTGILVHPHGGFYLDRLNFPTAETRQLEMRIKTDAPGMVETVWAGRDARGKHFSGKKYHLLVPDKEFHWYIFPTVPARDASGKITNLQMKFLGDTPAHLDMTSINLRDRENLIPGAPALEPGERRKLDYLLPRRDYTLSWAGGDCPGVTLEFLDRDDLPMGTQRLEPGARKVDFTMPALALRATLKVDAAGAGHPEISACPEPLPEHGAWRGKWIWCQKDSAAPEHVDVWFEREFTLNGPVETATLAVAADDTPYVYVNGEFAGEGGSFLTAKTYDLAKFLRPGGNRLTIRVRNDEQNGGLLCDLYVRDGGKERYFCSDAGWKFRIGTAERPDAIDAPVFVLGDDVRSTPPWAGMLDYRYAGPRGKVKLLSTDNDGFTAEVLIAPPQLPKFLHAKLVDATGKTREVTLDAKIEISDGKFVCRFTPPPAFSEHEQKLYIADDRLEVADDVPVAVIPPEKPTAGGFAQARFVDVGGRVKLELDGRLHAPDFWHFSGAFRKNPAAHPEEVAEMREAGFDSFELCINFRDFWLGPGKYDFSKLDDHAALMLEACPDAIFFLGVGCFMPEWWVDDNPDDATVHADGSPRYQLREAQALSSKKWLRDAEAPLRALIDHLKNSNYGRRVWGVSVAEHTNSEWFWTIRDARGKPVVSGYSPADLATFREFLRRKYASDGALAAAWKTPGVTFDTAQMPPEEIHTKGRIGTLLDLELDRRLMDWFEYRNLSLAEALIELCRLVKDASGDKLLAGAYYGYFVEMASNLSRAVHDHGHNGWLETAKSPYVDFVRAPTRYDLRRIGLADGVMQCYDTYTRHGKVVYLECDLRTAYRESASAGIAIYVAHPSTGYQTVAVLNRAFGMSLATGIGRYWYDISAGGYREPVLQALLKEHKRIYEELPPVQNLTPREVAVVLDRDSVYFTKRNAKDTVLPAVAGPLFRELNRMGAAFSVLDMDDLRDEKLPPHKFYIMANAFSLSREQREKLLKRFAAEKATVLWFYAPGAFYPDRGPKQEFCGDFLGLKTVMSAEVAAPVMKTVKPFPELVCTVPTPFSPWFYPQSGFDEVAGRDDSGRPLLVGCRRDGATHYFSTLPALPVELLRYLAERAGVRLYTPNAGDPVWVGNDVVFLHAATTGKKSIVLPPGTRMRGLLGPHRGKVFDSGESWDAEAGSTHGFLVFR
jgi:hypothetical protein